MVALILGLKKKGGGGVWETYRVQYFCERKLSDFSEFRTEEKYELKKKRKCGFFTFLTYVHLKMVLTETRRQARNQLRIWVKIALLYIVFITFH